MAGWQVSKPAARVEQPRNASEADGWPVQQFHEPTGDNRHNRVFHLFRHKALPQHFRSVCCLMEKEIRSPQNLFLRIMMELRESEGESEGAEDAWGPRGDAGLVRGREHDHAFSSTLDE